MLTAIFAIQALLLVLVIVALVAGWRQLTRSRITIEYEPIVYVEKRLFRKKVVAGYRERLLYDGFPIGQPTERIVYESDEVDRTAIENALTKLLQTVQRSIEATSGVPFTAVKTIGEAISEAID